MDSAVGGPHVDAVEPVAGLRRGAGDRDEPVGVPVEADDLAGHEGDVERSQLGFDGGDQQRRVEPALLLQTLAQPRM